MNPYDHKNPTFDPFITIRPDPGFLRIVVKSLKNQASTILADLRTMHPFARSVIGECLEEDHKRILNRIKECEYRLSLFKRNGSYELPVRHDRITDEEIVQAKQQPIQNYYDGRLRKVGGKLWGLCPFHTERSASFCIYESQNSWWCYSCNEGGSVVDYIIKLKDIKFLDAVKFILNK